MSSASPTLAGHIAIARPDHWFKNVFVLPGVVLAMAVESSVSSWALLQPLIVGLASVCLIASSNYTLNEVLDAPFDRLHPSKRDRPVPAGRVHVGLAYLQWLALMVIGLVLGLWVSNSFAITMGLLWVMGVLYNAVPIRTKDRAYLDVVSEAVNNPLRLCAGWFIVAPGYIPPPASVLLFYWMIGCYFMALKRFAEYRSLGNPERAAAYRRSFAYYDEDRLLISVMFYSAASMLFFGAFIMRYRLELVLAFPFIALVMSHYLALGLRHDSPVQAPENLYRERGLMLTIMACTAVLVALMFIDLPVLHSLFHPLGPVSW